MIPFICVCGSVRVAVFQADKKAVQQSVSAVDKLSSELYAMMVSFVITSLVHSILITCSLESFCLSPSLL